MPTDGLRRSGASSDPCTKAKSCGTVRFAALAKAREAEGERRSATGMSEARSHQRRGKKTPTLMYEAVRQSMSSVLHRDPPKRFLGVVKRLIPPVMPYGA
jgi:hypothetical protein